MTLKFHLVFLFLAIGGFAVVHGAHILDIFDLNPSVSTSNDTSETRNEPERNSRNCLCKGSACVCCLDFNFTLIDLGGPGCVHMKYLSQDEGFAVNISYGKSMLHSSTIKGSNPPPICLDIFSKLAQMCTRFSELAPTSDGLRGCLQFEPHLLGDVQLEFPVGCFRSSPSGMEMEPPKAEEVTENTQQAEEDGGDESDGISAETILQVVNHTAEQGIIFFSSLLGIGGPPKTNATQVSTTPNTNTNPPSVSTEETPARRGKEFKVKHPNIL